MQHSFRTSDGLSIAYHQDCFAEPWRPAEVVLMLHSMMGDSRRFFQWVPPLSAHYDVVRMDMRGHG